MASSCHLGQDSSRHCFFPLTFPVSSILYLSISASSVQLLWLHEARWFIASSLLFFWLVIFYQKLTHYSGNPLDRVRRPLTPGSTVWVFS